MEKLRVRAGSEELKVEGSSELIQREREAFYKHVKEMQEVGRKSCNDVVYNMRGSLLVTVPEGGSLLETVPKTSEESTKSR